MSLGTIEGGWGFVVAAYVVTWTAIGLYAASLLWRSRKTATQNGKSKQGEP